LSLDCESLTHGAFSQCEVHGIFLSTGGLGTVLATFNLHDEMGKTIESCQTVIPSTAHGDLE